MFRLFAFCGLCFWHLVVFADSGSVQSVSVTEGESVTLQSYLTEIQIQDLITWTFELSTTKIAEINREDNIFSTSDGPGGRFRDRLKLDHQTGSLTITNTRTTDSGNYTVIIKSSNTVTHRFSVTVYGSESQTALISAAVAGSLLIVAAVGIFWICCRRRKTNRGGTNQSRTEDITYADPTFFKQKAKKPGIKQQDEVLYADIVTKN